MLKTYRVSLLALTLAVPAFAGTASAADADAVAQICAEAQSLFEEIKALPPEEGLPPAKPGTVHVLTLDYTFCPPLQTVKVGTTVRFVNVEKRTSHSVWFKEAGREESPRLFPVEFWETTFDTPGRYPYLCGPHWEQRDMRGVLEVTD